MISTIFVTVLAVSLFFVLPLIVFFKLGGTDRSLLGISFGLSFLSLFVGLGALMSSYSRLSDFLAWGAALLLTMIIATALVVVGDWVRSR